MFTGVRLALVLASVGLIGCQTGGGGPATVPLTSVSGNELGFTINVPQDSEVVELNDKRADIAYVLPGGLFEYRIRVTPEKVRDLDSAVRTAMQKGGSVAEKKALDDGYLVVKQARPEIEEVWVFRAPLAARCTGPTEDHDVLLVMCTSLQSSP